MLLDKYQAIFIHVPKVAGQSIEHFFLDKLNITKKDALPLLIGPNPNSNQGPPKLAHLTALELLKYKHISPENFNTYFKFAFVRNPWSRAVSFYKFLGFQSFISFEKFVLEYLSAKNWNDEKRYWFVRPQAEFVVDEESAILVDFIGKIENINEDFNFVLKRLNFEPAKLPYINKFKNSYHKKFHTLKKHPELIFKQIISQANHFKNYKDYYNSTTKKIVGTIYSQDIDLFKYSF